MMALQRTEQNVMVTLSLRNFLSTEATSMAAENGSPLALSMAIGGISFLLQTLVAEPLYISLYKIKDFLQTEARRFMNRVSGTYLEINDGSSVPGTAIQGGSSRCKLSRIFTEIIQLGPETKKLELNSGN